MLCVISTWLRALMRVKKNTNLAVCSISSRPVVIFRDTESDEKNQADHSFPSCNGFR